ncbi:MAG TPA: glycosyltransferase family 4 protein [Chryseolinea sp.]|nr:glycosyltransferase family 4 protein [Chryseolinea sp.]
MKVLILHQHFNIPQEGGALRSYYLAKALVDHGFQPIVITGRSRPPAKSVLLEGIDIHYLPVAYDNKFGFWKRAVSFFQYVWLSTRLAGSFKDVKVCYAISAPLTVGIAASCIKFFDRIPFIFEVGDLWPEAPIQMGFVRSHVLKWLLYEMERFIYSDAKSIVALSEKIKEGIEKRAKNKIIHVIPNMADTEFYHPELKQPLLESRFSTEGKFVVSYVGAIGLANGLDFFMECARASQRATQPIHFLLCGEGAMVESLKRVAQQYQLQNFSIIPFQDRKGVKEIMNVTDAAFICYKPLPILETGSPNKYFDALASGKLILLNFGGWIKEEVEKERCGCYINARQPSEFVGTIQPFIDSKQLLKEYQQASRRLAEEKYTRSMLSNKFAEIFT